MLSVDPKTSLVINIALTAAGAVLGFLSTTKLPSTVPAADASMIQEWATWLLAGGTSLVGALNVYLHSVSSTTPGPLSSDKR